MDAPPAQPPPGPAEGPNDDELERLLQQRGPLLGSEVVEHFRCGTFTAWRACVRDPNVALVRTGQRYLRLDSGIEDWARLSPSIGREFLTYTVVHRRGDEAAAEARRESVSRHTAWVGHSKRQLAAREVARILSELDEAALVEHVAFLIAGDVVYGMAHDVPRAEVSTDLLVLGSDLDILVVHSDDLAAELVERLDSALHRTKARLLTSPSYREEIDYVVKSLSRAREQTEFDTFKHGVASKVMSEAEYLAGSRAVYDELKAIIEGSTAGSRLREMTQKAVADRVAAERRLAEDEVPDADDLRLFTSREEASEFW